MDYEQMSKNERMAKLKNLVEKQNFFFTVGKPETFRSDLNS